MLLVRTNLLEATRGESVSQPGSDGAGSDATTRNRGADAPLLAR